jgi:lipooligosaccharide transport system permease protein
MRPALYVLEFFLVGYRRTWRGSVLGSFVLPVLYVLGFGLGVGHFIDLGGQLGTVKYLDFIVPGMVAATAAQVAFGESAWPVLSRFMWIRTYWAMVAAPLRIVDILGGSLLFVLVRLTLTTVVFLLVTVVFGAVHSVWVVTVPVICGLLGIAVATPIFALAASVDIDSYFPLVGRFLIIPMMLFSGVYFPIAGLPEAMRWLAYVSPLWHAVDLCRAATLGGALPWLTVLGHLAYLGALAALGFWLAMRAFQRKLAV